MTVSLKLKPHDPSKPSSQQGLYEKFHIERTDGASALGGKHHGCQYFILDLTHDQHAKAALLAYAQSCALTHPELSHDLYTQLGEKSPHPL